MDDRDETGDSPGEKVRRAGGTWKFVGLRSLTNCNYFIINGLIFGAKMSQRCKSTTHIVSPTGC